MIAPFVGVCPTCQHDHGGDFLEDEPSLDQYRSLYFAQCAKTDELAEEVKKKSDTTLLARIKELEEQIVQLNKTVTERNVQIASSPKADGIKLKPVSYANPMDILSYRNNYSVTEEKTMTNTVPLYTQDQVNVMLSAYKPQADDVPPDVYDIVVDTGDGIYHTAEVVHFQQRGSKRMIQVRLGEPKADDVRKDAEREWTENDGNHESSKKLANRMGRIDVKFRSGFVAKDYSPNDFDFSQSGSDHDITAFRPHKFEKAIDKARE